MNRGFFRIVSVHQCGCCDFGFLFAIRVVVHACWHCRARDHRAAWPGCGAGSGIRGFISPSSIVPFDPFVEVITKRMRCAEVLFVLPSLMSSGRPLRVDGSRQAIDRLGS